jgi:hypothetical protein
MSGDLTRGRSELKSLCVIGGVAAVLQLATILAMVVVGAASGSTAASAQEIFELQQQNRVQSILQGDALTTTLIGLYLGTIPALYVALKRVSPVYAALAALCSIMAVLLAFAGDTTFSLLRLGDLYAAAESDALRVQYLAAGEAVISLGVWNHSSAYAAGILLQGAGVVLSVIMLRSRDFHKLTAWTGLIGNALDLVQHLIHPFAPSASDAIKMVMGVPYLLWFVMLAWDMLRLGLRRAEA